MYASLLCVLILSLAVDSSKILIYVGNLPMGSHVRVSNFLGNSLVQHGHDVWFLIPDAYYDRRIKEDKGKVFSYLTIPVNFTAEQVDRANNDFLDKSMKGETASLYNSLKILLSNEQKRVEGKRFKNALEVTVVACDILLNDDALITKIRKEKFDFLIGDSLMPCHHLLSKRISTSYATLDVPPVLPALVSKIRVPSNPAYVPEGFSQLTDEMNFFQRLLNFFMAQAVPLAMDVFIYNPILAIEKQDNIKDVRQSSQENLFSGVDIWFGVNCHPAIEFPRPVTIDMLCTRGMLSTPSKPIFDEQLLSFVQSARHGVVLISMGSLVNMSSGDLLETFAAAFSRLPHRVVWKYNSEFPPRNLGNNTKLMSWIPQNDLLGHPNIKAMMYHGGINGVYQAVYHGKPVIGLPMYQDQHDNIARLKARGMAEIVDCKNITEENIYHTIMTVTSNKSYQENAAFRSKIIRNTVHAPEDEVTKWIEHVIKYGSNHLHSGANSLSSFEYFLIDVISIIILVCSLTFLSIYIVLNLLIGIIKSLIGNFKQN